MSQQILTSVFLNFRVRIKLNVMVQLVSCYHFCMLSYSALQVNIESLPAKPGSMRKAQRQDVAGNRFSSCPSVTLPAVSTSFTDLGSLRHAEIQSLDLLGLSDAPLSSFLEKRLWRITCSSP